MNSELKSRIIDRYLKMHNEKFVRLSVGAGEYENRILDVLNSPYNLFIERVYDAGSISGNYITMHNGLKINIDSYYPDLINPMLELNRGVHEPEEEACFSRVLRLVKKDYPVMIELGSYWAFYSMWFLKEYSNGTCYMVEPDSERLKAGKDNFVLNGFEGSWTQDTVGKESLIIDKFVKDNSISQVDILHSDIQGAEVEMLKGAADTLRSRKVDYLFVSTHSNELHDHCLKLICDYGYHILFESNMNTSSCYDGVIVASRLEQKIIW